MSKVDVIINVFGKPFQTLCTLKSLMLHSGKHIDKIYFIEERKQPYGEKVRWIIPYFNNIIHYIPKKYQFIQRAVNYQLPERRFTIRYQYGIENSNKKYVFITHNDVLYTGDIIGTMLGQIEGHAGIGPIGQCWNCPAFTKELCNGDKYHLYNPTYDEVAELIRSTPSPRTTIDLIDKTNPTPLPECRLNEWACLINRDIVFKECKPNGDGPLFGMYDIMDLGVGWFRHLILKNYTFKNFKNLFIHGFWASGAGYPNQLDKKAYKDAEALAKSYYIDHFQS